MALLEVADLSVRFRTDRGTVVALDGVDFSVDRGETVCLVGESGSGKTVCCSSLTRLLPSPPAQVEGAVRFDEEDLLAASERRLRAIRGGRIAHVFQNPQSALDPVYAVGDQLVEAMTIHGVATGTAARRRAVDILDRVGIPDPAARVDDYPHELSGGMTQRVVIAMALAADPDLLVADEPTTALDVTTEAAILDLLAELAAERDLAVLLVTHDLGVVAGIADRVVVLYAGKVMERGTVEAVFDRPAHPYTRALLESLPGADADPRPIGGSLPDPRSPPAGCRFHPRCRYAVDECRDGGQPPMHAVDAAAATAEAVHAASCVHHRDAGGGGDAPVGRELPWLATGQPTAEDAHD